MKIDQETLAVLDRCTTAPCVVVLPEGQLPRALYTKVNKVLEAAGGKWDRKIRAHVFTEDATAVIEQALLTGEVGNPKQELGIFYTPRDLAVKAARLLDLRWSGITVLEPSAGMGALASAVRDVSQEDDERCSWADITCLDILPKHVVALREAGFVAQCADFLDEDESTIGTFDRIIMNPPFAKQDDALHFLHAIEFLNPRGRIVCIMSAAVTFRDTLLYRRVRELAPEIHPLPAGSFKSSGTMVNTVIVVYDKPEAS